PAHIECVIAAEGIRESAWILEKKPAAGRGKTVRFDDQPLRSRKQGDAVGRCSGGGEIDRAAAVGLYGVSARRERDRLRPRNVYVFQTSGDFPAAIGGEGADSRKKSACTRVRAAHKEGVLALQAGVGEIPSRRRRGRRGAATAARRGKCRQAQRQEQRDAIRHIKRIRWGGRSHRAPPCWFAAAFLAAASPRGTPGLTGTP